MPSRSQLSDSLDQPLARDGPEIIEVRDALLRKALS